MKYNHYLSYLFLLLISTASQAQFVVDWNNLYSHTSSPNYSCEGRFVFNDAAGNTYVVADATSDVDPQGNVTTSTHHYVTLRKYDPFGGLITKTAIDVQGHLSNGFSSKSAFGAAIDSTGNLFVGYHIDDGFNDFEIRYSKFDSNLDLQWTQKYVNTAKETGVAMAVDNMEKAFILCYSDNAGTKTYRILKSDPVNNDLGVHYSYDPNTDYLNDIIIDASGNSYVTGYRVVSGFKSILTSSVSQSGMLRWKYVSNGGSANRDDYGVRLMKGSDNFLYVIGSSDRSFSTSSNFDISIFKHNPVSGKRVWEKYDHTDVDDRGHYLVDFDIDHIAIAGVSGNNIVVGRVRKNDSGGGSTNGATSGKIVYAPKPDEPYTALMGASLSGFYRSPNNRFYVTGTINANSVSGAFSAAFLTKMNFITGSRVGFRIIEEYRLDGTNATSYASAAMNLDLVNNRVTFLRDEITDFINHTNENIDVRALSAPTSIRLADEQRNNFTEVYPNPSSGGLMITSAKTLHSVEVYAVSGALVKKVPVESATLYKMDLSELKQGLYLLKVIYSDLQYDFHKVTIQR